MRLEAGPAGLEAGPVNGQGGCREITPCTPTCEGKFSLTQAPRSAQGSPRLLETGGSSCPPQKRVFCVPAAHLQRLLQCLHPPTAGHSSGGGPRSEPLRPAQVGWGAGELRLFPPFQSRPDGPAYLIEHKLCAQVEISARGTQVALDQSLHALLLQRIRHIIEGVLVRKCCQCLERADGRARLRLMETLRGPELTLGSPHFSAPPPHLVDEGDCIHQQLRVSAILLLQDGHQIGPRKRA